MFKFVSKKQQSSPQFKTHQTDNSNNHNQGTPYSDSQKFQEEKILAIKKLGSQVLANFPIKFHGDHPMQLMKSNIVEKHGEETSSVKEIEEDIEMSDREDEQMEIVIEVNHDEEEHSSIQATDHSKKKNRKKGQSVVSHIKYNEYEHEEGNENNVRIHDIIIGGRTPSPFAGTMGAHSTAWIAHIDAVRRQLIGYHLDQAIGYLIDYANLGLNSPLLKLKDSLDNKHKGKLNKAEATLKKTIEFIKPYEQSSEIKKGNRATIEKHLRKLIKDYLTFTNYLPLSTVKGGNTGGHAEGKARKFLNLFEYGNSRNDLISDLEKDGKQKNNDLLNYYQQELENIKKEEKDILLENLKVSPNVKGKVLKKIWDLFAVDTPGVFAEQNKKDKDSLHQVWALALNNFLTTIRMAYPYAYEFVEMHDLKVVKKSLISKLKSQEGIPQLSEDYKINESDVDKIINYSEKDFTPIANNLSQSQPVTLAVGPSDGHTENSGQFICYFLLEENTIGDVVFQGRTEKVFKGEGDGAHSIAWIALTDSVRKVLIGKSLDDAFLEMKKLVTEAIESPAASDEMVELADTYQKKLFKQSKEKLENEVHFDTNYYVQQSNAEKQRILEQYVTLYFEFVNSTPLTTVGIADTTGDAEGYYRQILINFEQYGPSSIPKGKQKKATLQEALLRMYDAKAIRDFSPHINYKGALNEKSAELHIKKWAYSLGNLLITLERAYQKSFKYAKFKEYLIEKKLGKKSNSIKKRRAKTKKESESSTERFSLEEIGYEEEIVTLLRGEEVDFKNLPSISKSEKSERLKRKRLSSGVSSMMFEQERAKSQQKKRKLE